MRTLDVRDAPPHHTPTNTFHRPTHDDERGKDNGEEASMDLVGARRLCDEAEYGIQHRSNGGKLMDPLEVVRSEFLFQLAAFDEEWRTRMVETLEASSILNDRADDGGVISAAAAPNDGGGVGGGDGPDDDGYDY